MKTTRYTKLRAVPMCALSTLLFVTAATAQTAFPSDPHDPMAYQESGALKGTATPGRLLSTVNYITRQATLSGYDSSRITYDGTSTRITELKHFRRDAGVWRPFDRFTYTFNSSGLNDQTVYEFYDPLKTAYFPVARYNYSHDGSGNKSDMFYEVYNVTSGVYRNGMMERYVHDASGLRTSMHQQIWTVSTTAWDNSTLETMAYNAQGKMTSYTIQTWNFTLAAWENKRQTLNSYDGSGNLLAGAEDFTWAGPSLGWRPKSRTTNALAGGKVSEQVVENYNNVNSTWVPNTKQVMSYLSSGNLGTSVMAAWAPASGNFADQSRASYTYNSDNQIKRVLTLVRTHGGWGVDSGAGETVHYYEGEKQPQLSVAGLPAGSPVITLSPVPAGSTLNLRYAAATNESLHISITDMAGRRISTFSAVNSGSSPISLDIRSMPAGVYSLSVTSSQGARQSALFTVSR